MIEPPVEPADGPTNISSSSVIVASAPHAVESAVPKPVVVIDTDWKAPSRNASSPLAKPPASSSSVTSAEPTTANAR